MQGVLKRRRGDRRAGFTLIEVVIALAIFAIGAAAVVQVFAPALSIIQTSGEDSIATKGSDDILTRGNTKALGAPDWIFNTDPLNGDPTQSFWADLGVAFNGTSSRNGSIPRNPQQLSQASPPPNALTGFRHIEGERQKVYQVGSNEMVFTNFPYSGSVNVYTEDTITGVQVVDDAGHLNFANARLASTGEKWVCSTVPNDHISPRSVDDPSNQDRYFISYRWIDGDGTLQGVTGEAYRFVTPFGSTGSPSVPSGNPGQLMQGMRIPGTPVNGLPAKVVRGTVGVRILRPQGAWGPAATSNGDDIRGVATALGSTNLVGQTVYLIYDVKDWRWMVNDGAPVVANNGLTLDSTSDVRRTLNLPARGLGDPNTPVWLYSTSWQAGSNSNNSIAEIARDSFDGTNTSGDNADNRLIGVNTKSGQLSYEYLPTFPAPRTRVAYLTQDGWARQLSVAAISYVPHVDPGTIQPSGVRPPNYVQQPWREYFWERHFASGGDTSPDRLLFQPAEAGKTVLVTFTYQTPGGPVTESDTLAIDIHIDASAPPSGLPGSGVASKLQLYNSSGVPVQAIAILDVQGVSVQSRSAYVGRGNYKQVITSVDRKLMVNQ